ncbi:MAG: hypothetical protein NHB14_16405 [Desulfosporosinus sp.]|nr:hypothetical protein [Desulfosporosinus sp.]
MNTIKEYLLNQIVSKELLVFNSHSDWDHIWGNCVFESAEVIGHEKAKKNFLDVVQVNSEDFKAILYKHLRGL